MMEPHSEHPEPSIDVQKLVKKYGRTMAIQDISFTVFPGEIVGFLGPNGAGKSTTMRILSGFLPATSGSAFVCGRSVATDPTGVKQHLGYMPENNPLPGELRVGEYLAWRGRLKGIRGRDLRRKVDRALEVCDLARAESRIIGKLSKGYRQRVGVADAILGEPEVIIMDEPTIGLDPHQIIMIRDLISSLRGRMTVLLSSHILPEIEMTCDRVLIINAGRIVASGTPRSLRKELVEESTYELELAGKPATLRRHLASLHPGMEVSLPDHPPNGDFFPVSIKCPDSAIQADQLLHSLCGVQDLKIRSFRQKEPSLEEVFLAATRRGWEVTAPLGRSTTRLQSSGKANPQAAPSEPVR